MPRRRPNTDPTLVIGYVRVSTDEQALGPNAQRDALRRWCEARGAELVGTYEDLGVSGGAELDKRPGLQAALAALAEHGAGVLLVAKRDRLARDVMIAAMVERLAARQGARIDSADGSGNGTGPEAEMMRGIMAVFAQYERALIRFRTRTALEVKRRRQERVGEIPLGYRLAANGQALEPDPAEGLAVARVHQLRAAGLSIRAIAAALNEEAVPARGARWHPTTVSRLLRRHERAGA